MTLKSKNLFIIKRDKTIVEFNEEKIAKAIEKALKATGEFTNTNLEKVKNTVLIKIDNKINDNTSYSLTVEEVQDMVEESLMTQGLHITAKAYIIYREKRAEERKRDIFKKRLSLKPYEYPELYEYVDAIRHSYWLHSEFNFTSDIHDFKVNTNEIEKNAIKNTMLAIAQIEVSVKTFWGDIYKKLPKPEIGAVGATFAESEVRHADAYSALLEVLGLNNEFENIKNNEAIMNRIHYVEKALKYSSSDNVSEYSKTLLLFSLFIEHVSLFSQFFIMMSFNKHKSLFRGLSNAIAATAKEEEIHGRFGIDLINIIKEENPIWFDESFTDSVTELCKEAFEAESNIIDWIFEKGELDFVPKDLIKEFIKNRFNNSLVSLGLSKIFEINQKLLEESSWFEDEIMTTTHVDFFVKKSVNYNKRVSSITADDLF